MRFLKKKNKINSAIETYWKEKLYKMFEEKNKNNMTDRNKIILAYIKNR